jgi:hypothetical protein
MKKLALGALKWTAIAIWLDMSDRLIGSPLDAMFARIHALAWLDGYTNVVMTCAGGS